MGRWMDRQREERRKEKREIEREGMHLVERWHNDNICCHVKSQNLTLQGLSDTSWFIAVLVTRHMKF